MPTELGSAFMPGRFYFYVNMGKYPVWAIPFTRVVPRFWLEPGSSSKEDFSDVDFFQQSCRTYWYYVGEVWKIRVEMEAEAVREGKYLPLYMDIDLVITNERVWEEINSDKR